jgi:hypothetical protein
LRDHGQHLKRGVGFSIANIASVLYGRKLESISILGRLS